MILKSSAELQQFIKQAKIETLIVRPCEGPDLTEALLEIESWQLNSDVIVSRSAYIMLVIDVIGDLDLLCLNELYPDFILIRKRSCFNNCEGLLKNLKCTLRDIDVGGSAVWLTVPLLRELRRTVYIKNCYCLKGIKFSEGKNVVSWCNHALSVDVTDVDERKNLRCRDYDKLKEGFVVISNICMSEYDENIARVQEQLLFDSNADVTYFSFGSLLTRVSKCCDLNLSEVPASDFVSDRDLSVYGGLSLKRLNSSKVFFCSSAKALISQKGIFSELSLAVSYTWKKLQGVGGSSCFASLNELKKYGMSIEQSETLFYARQYGLLNLYRVILPELVSFLAFSKIFAIKSSKSEDRIILWIKALPGSIRLDIESCEPLGKSNLIRFSLKYSRNKSQNDIDGDFSTHPDIVSFFEGLNILVPHGELLKSERLMILHMCVDIKDIKAHLDFLENYFISNFYLLRDV